MTGETVIPYDAGDEFMEYHCWGAGQWKEYQELGRGKYKEESHQTRQVVPEHFPVPGLGFERHREGLELRVELSGERLEQSEFFCVPRDLIAKGRDYLERWDANDEVVRSMRFSAKKREVSLEWDVEEERLSTIGTQKGGAEGQIQT